MHTKYLFIFIIIFLTNSFCFCEIFILNDNMRIVGKVTKIEGDTLFIKTDTYEIKVLRKNIVKILKDETYEKNEQITTENMIIGTQHGGTTEIKTFRFVNGIFYKNKIELITKFDYMNALSEYPDLQNEFSKNYNLKVSFTTTFYASLASMGFFALNSAPFILLNVLYFTRPIIPNIAGLAATLGCSLISGIIGVITFIASISMDDKIFEILNKYNNRIANDKYNEKSSMKNIPKLFFYPDINVNAKSNVSICLNFKLII